MEKKMTTEEYFRLPESLNPMELVWGYVHEPPAPRYGHQSVVGQLHWLLKSHVEERRLGEICLSPLDVVLDNDAALVVQPDIFFVASGRLDIIRERVWGAPDLVVEVLSPSTAYRDRTLKLAWYQRYGVQECWLVDSKEQRVEIVDLPSGSRASFTGPMPIRSRVLPDFDLPAAHCFPGGDRGQADQHK
jgi:Uma2 family endonuclease